jgi:UDP-N-acetylglucosamine 2-epimerase (non-hydrolysing)
MVRVAVTRQAGHPVCRAPADVAPKVLHLALTRSAAVRLAPVAAAQRGPHLVVESTGRLSVWCGTEPPLVSATALQAATVSRAVSAAIERTRPDAVLIAGDDDAALASALAAVRANVPIARLGAGLRCGDRGLRREINRIAIDELATRLYADNMVAGEQLRAEGFDDRAVLQVGSTLPATLGRWRGRAAESAGWTRFGLAHGEYALVSLRRAESLAHGDRIGRALAELAKRIPVALCSHARLHSPLALSAATLIPSSLDYADFVALMAGAGLVVTDSATIQEETTLLGVPCFTLARSSECVGTLTHGTNTLLGDDPAAIAELAVDAWSPLPEPTPLWVNDAGQQVADDLLLASWGTA